MKKFQILAAAAVAAALIACGAPATHDDDTTPLTTDTSQAEAAPAGSTDATPAAKATAAPKKISAEQANAARSAESYLTGPSSFSRKSLISQLKYEGYSTKAATAAVDSLHVDWNAQAVQSAKSYLEMQGFSRKELLGQLKYEGFTQAQAEHGVKGAGL